MSQNKKLNRHTDKSSRSNGSLLREGSRLEQRKGLVKQQCYTKDLQSFRGVVGVRHTMQTLGLTSLCKLSYVCSGTCSSTDNGLYHMSS